MQTLRHLALEIILLIMGFYFIMKYSFIPDKTWVAWFWIVVGILDLLVSVPKIIKYFIEENKKK